MFPEAGLVITKRGIEIANEKTRKTRRNGLIWNCGN